MKVLFSMLLMKILVFLTFIGTMCMMRTCTHSVVMSKPFAVLHLDSAPPSFWESAL